MDKDPTTFKDRLATAIGGESVNSFAKRCEVSEGTVRNCLKGGMPGADIALRMADAAAVNLLWLISGRGVKEASALSGLSARHDQPLDDAMLANMIMVPRFDVQASAGHGSVGQAENVIDNIAFKSSWLRDRGINPSFASILEAKGDSMEPTIRDGDMLIVDRSISTVTGNGIYIVIFGGNVLVKRINMRRDASLVLISDNERYGEEVVPADEVPDVHIAARVMWYGRSI
jgi:phage repressor protein C with HTH and peptisase S24 domain